MITTQPDVQPDGLYSLTQAALALKIDRHTLARYVKGGAIRFRRRKADGRPVTTGAEIIRMWRSRHQ
jgi:predicted site-specific integrase-resolvase